VLHDGVAAILARSTDSPDLSTGRKVIVLTNSGKDASANQARLAALDLRLKPPCRRQFWRVALQLVSARTRHQVRDRRTPASSDDAEIPMPFHLAISGWWPGRRTPVPGVRRIGRAADVAGGLQSMLTPAAQARVPAICVNPTYDDPRWPACSAPGASPGLRKPWCQVEYIGKPHSAIFRHALTIAAPAWTLASS